MAFTFDTDHIIQQLFKAPVLHLRGECSIVPGGQNNNKVSGYPAQAPVVQLIQAVRPSDGKHV